jgi:hypothetical protein
MFKDIITLLNNWKTKKLQQKNPSEGVRIQNVVYVGRDIPVKR